MTNQGASIGELQELRELKGCSRITGFERVAAVANAAAGNLRAKEHLAELLLEGRDLLDLVSEGRQSLVANGQSERILEALKPQTNLQTVDIVNYRGTQFPDWVDHAKFKNWMTSSTS